MVPLLLAVFVIMQFYRPEKNVSHGNHSNVFLTETNPDQEVKNIFLQTCYNCHSDHTDYPWYNNVAPISYWMSNRVKKGKEHLNFSEWDEYSKDEKSEKLQEIIKMVEEEKMPLMEYKWIHQEARLGHEQRNGVIEWAKRTNVLYQLNRQPK